MENNNIDLNKDKTELDKSTIDAVVEYFNTLSIVPEAIKNMTIKEISEGLTEESLLKVGNLDIEGLSSRQLKTLSKNLFDYTGRQVFNIADGKSVGIKPVIENDADLYYDYELKNEFANQHKKSTARVVRSLFRRTSAIEKKYDKDLYRFNINEISEVLYSLKSTTIRSLQNTISTIETYMRFAHGKGLLEHEVNIDNVFDSRDKIEKFIDESKSALFGREEIMTMAMDTDNAQDGVILALLFDGVSHKNEFEELINLTRQDIDFDNNIINLPNRSIKMSDETSLLVKNALLMDTYYSINGDRVRKYKITEGDYVIRGLRKKLQVKSPIISERIIRVAEKFGEKKALNATTVSYSGQVYYAVESMKINNCSTNEVVDEILSRFNIPINKSSQFYLKTRIEDYIGENY